MQTTSTSQAVLGSTQLTLRATHPTPGGASRLVQVCACLVGERPQYRHCRGARVYRHTTTAMHANEHTHTPLARSSRPRASSPPLCLGSKPTPRGDSEKSRAVPGNQADGFSKVGGGGGGETPEIVPTVPRCELGLVGKPYRCIGFAYCVFHRLCVDIVALCDRGCECYSSSGMPSARL